VIEFGIIQLVEEPTATDYSIWLLQAYTVVYLLLAAALFYGRSDSLREIGSRSKRTIFDAYGIGDSGDETAAD
jgi:cation:H+ antiporter